MMTTCSSHIQTAELTEIEKEKEALNTDLINCKARLLKQEENEKKWTKDADFWVGEKRVFEARQVELEREFVRFLTFKLYDLRILSEKITSTTINHMRQ